MANYGQLDSAIILGEKALIVMEGQPGESDVSIAQVSFLLSNLYYRERQYLKAEESCRRALTILERYLPNDDLRLTACLDILASVLSDQGDFSDAEPVFRRALEIRIRWLNSADPKIALAMNNLATVLSEQGRYVEADSLYTRALAILVNSGAADFQFIAAIEASLAGNLCAQGQYVDAEGLLRQALAIEDSFGLTSPERTSSLDNLVSCVSAQGRYREADSLAMRAVAISETYSCPDCPEVAYSLQNLASVLLLQSRYSDAEVVVRRALGIYEKRFDPSHFRIALCLNTLAGICDKQFRYEEAESMYRRALAIRQNAVEPNFANVAQSLNNLASTLTKQKRWEEAEDLFRQASNIYEKALGSKHSDFALSLQNLASTFSDKRNRESQLLLERALAIYEEKLEPNHPRIAQCLSNLALTIFDQGDYPAAEPLFRRALAIRQASLSRDHPDLAESWLWMSIHFRALGMPDSALACLTEAADIYFYNFRNNAWTLNDEDMLGFARSAWTAMNMEMSCVADLNQNLQSEKTSVIEDILSAKGLALEVQRSRQRNLVVDADSSNQDMINRLRASQFSLARLFASGPGNEPVKQFHSILDSISASIKQLEAELYLKSANFRRKTDEQNVTITGIDSALATNTSLIEYVRWLYHVPGKDSIVVPHYSAIVLHKGKLPQLVDLGPADSIEGLVQAIQQHMQAMLKSRRLPTEAAADEFRRLSRPLYQLVWQPLCKFVSASELVFVCPDGSLNQVSFASLVDDSGSYLIETTPLQYLTAARDLLLNRASDESGSGLLAMGSPDYNAAAELRSVRMRAGLDVSDATSFGYANSGRSQGIQLISGGLQESYVDSLPHTRLEVMNLLTWWRTCFSESVFGYFDADATEDRFKRDASGKRVIHLATHGYFIEGNRQSKQYELSDWMAEKFTVENPLLLSGLFLAGSNLHGKGCDSIGVDDGILSAYEVQGLDLKGVELVVLSACESGRGAVRYGEGIYGLRRAFLMAGAKTVLSTLWPIVDGVAQEMMEVFYAESSQPISLRVRAMQLDQLNKMREDNEADHPLLWAPFVVSGKH